MLGNDYPWHFCMSWISFCSELSFQWCLYSKQPWKIEILSLQERGQIWSQTRIIKIVSSSKATIRKVFYQLLWTVGFSMFGVPQIWYEPPVCAASWVAACHPCGVWRARATNVNIKLRLLAEMWVVKSLPLTQESMSSVVMKVNMEQVFS